MAEFRPGAEKKRELLRLVLETQWDDTLEAYPTVAIRDALGVD